MSQGTGTMAVAGILVLAALAGCVGMDDLPGGNESNASDENLTTQNATLSNDSMSEANNTTANTSQAPPGNATLMANTTEGQAPLPLTFTLNATHRDNATWSLSFGDGNESDGNTTSLPTNVTHTYQASGNYTANLTVTYEENVTRSDGVDVTVTAPATNETEEATEVAPCQGTLGEGTIAAGHPGTYGAGLASGGGSAGASQTSGVGGVDGFQVDLPETCWGVELIVTGTSAAGEYDMDIFYYNEAGDSTNWCSSAAADEVCTVPDDTAYAWVTAFQGFNIEAELAPN